MEFLTQGDGSQGFRDATRFIGEIDKNVWDGMVEEVRSEVPEAYSTLSPAGSPGSAKTDAIAEVAVFGDVALTSSPTTMSLAESDKAKELRGDRGEPFSSVRDFLKNRQPTLNSVCKRHQERWSTNLRYLNKLISDYRASQNSNAGRLR